MSQKNTVLGLILELNPPHNGHKYFIEKAKELSNADIVIAVVSSSFSMRGDISVIDKFAKATSALSMGVDFVFELPYALATQSADYFAKNAINILVKLGVTDIAFGVETDSIDKLLKIKDIYKDNSYQELLKNEMDNGLSYSLANSKALEKFSNEELSSVATKPNNTLAIQYLKALEDYNDIKVHLVKRIENSYQDTNLNINNISSATAIRCAINENKDIKDNVINKDYDYVNTLKSNEELFKLLKYQYTVHTLDYFKNIKGVNEGIEIRFNKFINSDSYQTFVSNVQTKRYSVNHINRIILNMIIGVENKSYSNDYYRILAFNESKKDFFKTLNPIVKEKMFSSLNDANNELALIEAKVTKLYDLITGKNIFMNEYKAPLKENYK